MLTPLPSVWVGSRADSNAEFAVGNERSPFLNLSTLVVYKSSSGVTISRSTMRIELSSAISRFYVELGKISSTGDLGVVRCNKHMSRVNGSLRHETSSVTRGGTPCDFFGLSLANLTVGIRGSPQAEVLYGVDHDSLTHRILRIVRTTVVVADLSLLPGLTRLIVDIVPFVGCNEG